MKLIQLMNLHTMYKNTIFHAFNLKAKEKPTSYIKGIKDEDEVPVILEDFLEEIETTVDEEEFLRIVRFLMEEGYYHFQGFNVDYCLEISQF